LELPGHAAPTDSGQYDAVSFPIHSCPPLATMLENCRELPVLRATRPNAPVERVAMGVAAAVPARRVAMRALENILICGS
jgi:hypothetical protein